ncbi:hypothetical protein C440_10093 [Haloferax mucosum ATCC BAA-1512]|uniref:Uncharacterized protein n=1 Tax=Haloferax mucosum ATCC BAA-1512 TaxID=662479 RepID=M0ID25_9EURY|nr:hypothetical protein [Haloferax mucosum]ELZ93962.1 hypothetical protein C440_10093 [Haloferax mucosum ATCC BAA-1512]
MATGTSDAGEGKRHNADSDIRSLLECILSDFSNISVKRVHNLSYLSEYKYWSDCKNRLTTAEYQPYLEGVHSEDIAEALDNFNGIETRRVQVGKDRVLTLKVKEKYDCNLDKNGREVVERVVDDFGEVPPATIQRVIADTKGFEEANSGTAIQFQ